MRNARTIAGYAAIGLVVAGLNLLVINESLFAATGLVPLGLGIVCAVGWFGMRVASPGQDGPGRGRRLNSVLSSVAFLGICIMLFAFSKRWDISVDLTQEGRRTLAPQTIQVLAGMSTEVNVTCFFVHDADERIRITQDKTARFLKQCQQHTGWLNVEFIDPQREPLRLQQLGLTNASTVGTIVVASGAAQREIVLSEVTSRLEERDFTNAVINVIRGSRPKVYFMTGHGERDIEDSDAEKGGSLLKLSLEREAHEVAKHQVTLQDQSIPDDCDVLVINLSGQGGDLYPHEIEALEGYADRGGRLLVLLNPMYINPEFAGERKEWLSPWLQKRFGVVINTDILISEVSTGPILNIGLIPDFGLLEPYLRDANVPDNFRGSFNSMHPITRALNQGFMMMPVRTVEVDAQAPESVSATSLLISTPDAYAETDIALLSEHSSYERDAHEAGGALSVAVASAVPTSIDADETGRKREARAVVVGNAEITSNQQMRLTESGIGPENFLLNSLAWLTESEELIAIRPTGNEDPPLELTTAEQRIIGWIASLGSVQVIALASIAMHLMRRKYQ